MVRKRRARHEISNRGKDVTCPSNELFLARRSAHAGVSSFVIESSEDENNLLRIFFLGISGERYLETPYIFILLQLVGCDESHHILMEPE